MPGGKVVKFGLALLSDPVNQELFVKTGFLGETWEHEE